MKIVNFSRNVWLRDLATILKLDGDNMKRFHVKICKWHPGLKIKSWLKVLNAHEHMAAIYMAL